MTAPTQPPALWWSPSAAADPDASSFTPGLLSTSTFPGWFLLHEEDAEVLVDELPPDVIRLVPEARLRALPDLDDLASRLEAALQGKPPGLIDVRTVAARLRLGWNDDRPERPTAGLPWRQGGRVPHHVYEQHGDEPDRSAWPDGDRPIGMFVDPDAAARAVQAVNRVAQLDRLRRDADRTDVPIDTPSTTPGASPAADIVTPPDDPEGGEQP